MDRIIPISTSALFYFGLSCIITKTIKPPEHLHEKQARDFLGQHVSLTHSVLAVFISFCVYLYDGGINYDAETTLLHNIALGVLKI